MSERSVKFLVPREGASIPIPGKRRMLAVAGERVRIDAYWQRRIDEGDVVVGSEAKTSGKSAPKAQET